LPAGQKELALAVVPRFSARSTACSPDGGGSAAWPPHQGNATPLDWSLRPTRKEWLKKVSDEGRAARK
ncbi:MAG TPA: hypothetical protein VMU95_23595, partial [Trebonia sp.]|nr:hypothetical protein [Trebonia sp.]